jgi:transposase/IS5 family transposase
MTMASLFKGYDRKTGYLLPPSLNDWLQKDHLAYFVADIVESIDLSEIKNTYKQGGAKGYSPEILISLIFYGYMTGVFSSRKIENATFDSIAFRYLAANQHPDHDTIASFRQRFLPQLKGIFIQILAIAREMGVKKVGTVSIDGTKVKANASKHHSLSWGYANKLEERLQSEIADLMKRAEEADCEKEDSGMKIPEEISIREKRLQGITEAKAIIAARAEERYALEKAQYDEKISKREEKNAREGKKRTGKQLFAPTCSPKDRDQVNITDAESRIMKTGGGFDQCYNAQAAVDIHSMLIVMADVTIHANDKKEIEPAIENIEKIPKNIAEIDTILADSGFHSAANMERCIEHKIAPLIAEKREKHHQSPTERFAEPLPLSENATAAERAAHRLKTQEGKRLYAKRKSTVEPVFGIIKQVMGFRRFMLRGEKKVKSEWDLVAICWNIKRLHKIKTSMT